MKKDQIIEMLIKENRELRKQNADLRTDLEISENDYRKLENECSVYKKFYEEHDGPIDRGAYENEDGLLYEEGLY